MADRPSQEFFALQAIARAYQQSRTLFVAADLGIADLLRDGPGVRDRSRGCCAMIGVSARETASCAAPRARSLIMAPVGWNGRAGRLRRILG